MAPSSAVIAALEDAGYRLTGPRRVVADLIARRGRRTFTAADLVADARAGGHAVGRATVFRALVLLERIDAVERIDLPSGGHAYVGCLPAHHHHVVCTRCAAAVEVGDLGLGAVAREIARRTGYRIDEHRLEMFGLCPACRAAGAPS